MRAYVRELADELRSLGPERFCREHPGPVLVVLGLAGELGSQRTQGTAVITNADALTVTSLVGRVFPLVKTAYATPGPISIGRTAENDVAIPEYSISKQHCLVQVLGSEVRLSDCGSTNGTIVNGVRLEPRKPVVLRGGDKIVLGRFALGFYGPRDFLGYLGGLK